MQKYPLFSRPFWILLIPGILALPATIKAAEKDELALALRQLNQVQSALERAKVVAAQDAYNGRFFFDYEQATRDLVTVKQGIEAYMTPSRAQPGENGTLLGQYRKEQP